MLQVTLLCCLPIPRVLDLFTECFPRWNASSVRAGTVHSGQCCGLGAGKSPQPAKTLGEVVQGTHEAESWSDVPEVTQLASGGAGLDSCGPGTTSTISSVYSQNKYV